MSFKISFELLNMDFISINSFDFFKLTGFTFYKVSQNKLNYSKYYVNLEFL